MPASPQSSRPPTLVWRVAGETRRPRAVGQDALPGPGEGDGLLSSAHGWSYVQDEPGLRQVIGAGLEVSGPLHQEESRFP